MREESRELSPVGITSDEDDGFILKCDDVVEPHEIVFAKPIIAASPFCQRLLFAVCSMGQ